MPYHLFEVFGVELEYMIVDRDTLAVKPVADELLREVSGSYVADVENGDIDWSNELVTHVVELKTHIPAPTLKELNSKFYDNVKQVNGLLEKHNAMLLPTGAHPLMDPEKDTHIWPHEHNEIYALYNRIFDCKGHGWSNLQSTHINLPFHGDEEFGRLHAAIRLLLPIIPALSASTPMLDGKITGFIDMRLETYRHNQARLPSIAGMIIPEQAFTKQEYHDMIYANIIRDITPHDEDNILHHRFLNSRGAIARFDRNAIEIRIIDIQECPAADIAILYAITETLKLLADERLSPLKDQKQWHEKDLAGMFIRVIRLGEQTVIDDPDYLAIFGLEQPTTAGELWQHIIMKLVGDKIPNDYLEILNHIHRTGTLSSRIIKALGDHPSADKVREVYRQLSVCLANNTMF